MDQMSGPLVSFECPVCGATLRGPEKYRGQEVRCSTCGVFVTVPSATPAKSIEAPFATAPRSTPATNTSGLLRWEWVVLLGVVYGPLLISLPFSLYVGAKGDAQSLRLCTMNLIFAALVGYCLMAGVWAPAVVDRILHLDLERKHIAFVFLPAFFLAIFLGWYTYSP